MEAIVCTFKVSLWYVFTEKFHTWKGQILLGKCVKRDHGVHHAEVWAVSCLCLLLVLFDIPQDEPITFPDKMDSPG